MLAVAGVFSAIACAVNPMLMSLQVACKVSCICTEQAVRVPNCASTVRSSPLPPPVAAGNGGGGQLRETSCGSSRTVLTVVIEDIWQQAPSLLGFEFKEARPFAASGKKPTHP